VNLSGSKIVKIAIVTQAYYPSYGGVTEHVKHTSQELERRGHEVAIITSYQGAWPDRNGKVIRIGRNLVVPFNGARVNIAAGFGISKKLRESFRGLRPDIVQVHCPLTPTIPLMAVKHAPCPVVGTFHSTCSSDVPYRLFKKPLLRYFNRLSGRIAVSPCARDFVSGVFPGDYDVIPNGVDTERFSPSSKRLGKFSDGRFNILFVGRLDPRKGIAYLLKACERLLGLIGPRFRLIIIGRGPHAGLINRFTSALGDCLVYEGNVHPELLPQYYQSADVFCSPATGNESFGIVLLEAMASATPLVVTDIPGYRGVVSPAQDAVLARPRDAGSLTNALLTLYEDEPFRRSLGQIGRKKAVEHSWPNIVDQLEAYFTSVLSESSSGAARTGGVLRARDLQREDEQTASVSSTSH
jgi:phosphatidylinositol alpha-mannosyltransferase